MRRVALVALCLAATAVCARQLQPPQRSSLATAQRLRGGAEAVGGCMPWLRVLRRMLFPGNPERVRAAVAPPPKAAERDAPEKPAGTNRASAKGKVKRGGAVKPGKVHHVHSKAEFEKLVKGTRAKQLIVVDFAATWCGPCQQMAPKFESMAAAMPHAKFVHVDVDECKEVSQQVRERAPSRTADAGSRGSRTGHCHDIAIDRLSSHR